MGAIVTMQRRSATLHRFPLAIVPVVGCSLACAPHHHPLAPCAVEDHAPDVRTRLVRLPWGPLTQAQDVNPWFGEATSSPLSLTHGALDSLGYIDLTTAQK